jgi:hypothetical protein
VTLPKASRYSYKMSILNMSRRDMNVPGLTGLIEKPRGQARLLQQYSVPIHTALALFLVIATFLLLFTTKSAQQIQDSLFYAYSAKTGLELFHPHHLIYTPMIRLFSQLLSSLYNLYDVIFAGQLHNILLATIAILSFFLILNHVADYTFLGLLGAIFFLVTRGFWVLSTQITMYVPVTGCLALLAAILIICRNNLLTFGKVVIIAVFFALAILYHQTNVLFSIPLGYYLIATQGKRHWKVVLAIITSAGLIVLSVYGLVFLAIKGSWSLDEFIRFCLYYTQEICLGGQCRYRPSNWGTLHNFGAAGIRSFLDSVLWNFTILPKSLASLFRFITAFSLIMLYAWHIRQIINHALHEKVRIFLLVWMTVYALFNFWWGPYYPHPFVVVLFPALLLTFLVLKDLMDKLPNSHITKIALPAAVTVTVLIIMTRNFYTEVLPLQKLESDSYLEAAELAAVAPPECMILTNYRIWNHLRYYFNRTEGVIQAKNPLSFFYESASLPKQYHLAKEGCVFVLASHAMPGFTMEDRFSLESNGYNNPSGWLSYIAWLFDFEYDTEGDLIASRKFEMVNLEEGGPYIFISSPKIMVRGLHAVFRSLDNQTDEVLVGEMGPFESWLASAYLEVRSK